MGNETTKMYMLTEEEVLEALAAYCKTDVKRTKVFFFKNDEDQPIDNLAGCQLIEEKE